MRKNLNFIYSAFVLNIFFIIILGIVYPLTMTGLSNVLFPYQSNGSMNKFGSELIGQNWQLDKYFHGRPSSSNYDPMASGGTNLSPIDSTFVKRMKDDENLPENLRTSSASGLDPHIDVYSAIYQIPRIAKARQMKEDRIKEIINKLTENPLFGFIGQERVNVLKLNIELDKI